MRVDPLALAIRPPTGLLGVMFVLRPSPLAGEGLGMRGHKAPHPARNPFIQF